MKRILFSLLCTSALISCSDATKELINPVDGRAIIYDEAQWESCTQNNEITALKIEYEHNLTDILPHEDKDDSDEDSTVFQKHCYIIQDKIWCDKSSPAYSILSMLHDDIRDKLLTCCYRANGNFFKTLPEERFLNTIEVENEEAGFLDQVLSDGKMQVPVLKELQTEENDVEVAAYAVEFDLENFGTCMAK